MGFDTNALREKLAKLTQSFTPAQLAGLGLLAVLTVVGSMAFLRWASKPDYTVLFSGLDARNTSDAVEQLDSEGISYKLSNDGSTILVPQGDVHDARLKLSASGLPAGGNAVGYEILDNQGLTTSEFRQRVDYQRAVEGELTRTLMAMDGVRAASVHLAIPEDEIFSDAEQPTRASVLLDTSTALNDEGVQSIVHLVAASVPGLTPENVTVADTSGRVLSNASLSDGAATDRQIRMQKAYEQQLASDATTMLSQVYGSGRAVVRVNAQLNFDERELESETVDSGDGVVVSETTESETFTGTGAPPEGVVGVDPDADLETDETNYEKAGASREFAVNRTVERSRIAPGQLERLSVAVVLDENAEPAPDPEQVQSIVAAALGIDPERGDSIVVDSIGFDTSLDEAAQEAEAAAASERSTEQLLGYARTGVGALVLLLVVFFLVRGMRRTTEEPIDIPADGPGSLAAAIAAAQPAGALGAGAATASPDAAQALAQGGGVATLAPPSAGGDPEVLSLIDQQPEEVAVLLRSWLGDRRG